MPTSPRGLRTSGGASSDSRWLADLSTCLAVVVAVILIVVIAVLNPAGSIVAIVVLSPFVFLVAVVATRRLLGRRSQRSDVSISDKVAQVDGWRRSSTEVDIDLVQHESGDLRGLFELFDDSMFGAIRVGTNDAAISAYLADSRVLVTGASGSIGSELCRQVARHSPNQLIMLDCNAAGLEAVRSTLENRELRDHAALVEVDIRDQRRVNNVFSDVRPDVVFHAAGLQSLPLLEGYPEQAWKTNVLGTNNVLRAAATHGVTKFVNVSTDRADGPSSVLGYTESLGEQLTAWYANRTRGAWVSVRFGKVLEASDHRLMNFQKQLESGGPLEVSHPDKTVCFASRDRVCELIVQAGASGERGEVLILDSGRPVRVIEIADRLIQASNREIELSFTGLAKNEALHETPNARPDIGIRRAHPSISHVVVPTLRPTKLGLFDNSSTTAALASLRSLCEAQAETDAL